MSKYFEKTAVSEKLMLRALDMSKKRVQQAYDRNLFQRLGDAIKGKPLVKDIERRHSLLRAKVFDRTIFPFAGTPKPTGVSSIETKKKLKSFVEDYTGGFFSLKMPKLK